MRIHWKCSTLKYYSTLEILYVNFREDFENFTLALCYFITKYAEEDLYLPFNFAALNYPLRACVFRSLVDTDFGLCRFLQMMWLSRIKSELDMKLERNDQFLNQSVPFSLQFCFQYFIVRYFSSYELFPRQLEGNIYSYILLSCNIL